MDPEDVVELLVGHLEERAVAHDPGIVDGRVDAAERRNALRHERLAARSRPHVVRVRAGDAALRLDLADDRVEPRQRTHQNGGLEPGRQLPRDDAVRADARARETRRDPLARRAVSGRGELAPAVVREEDVRGCGIGPLADQVPEGRRIGRSRVAGQASQSKRSRPKPSGRPRREGRQCPRIGRCVG